MIQTVGEFLQALIERESAALARQHVDHAPTIGAMYEGLTQEALRKTLPIAGPLAVVGGFAVGADGSKSRQLDCMVVIGDGERIPYTDSFNYPIDQVVVVVEVKKSLEQSCFEEAFQNLQSLHLQPFRPWNIRSDVEVAFQLISGRPLPDDPATLTDPILQQLLYQLKREAASPARILLGYEGYKTLRGLRRGIVEQLKQLVGSYGAGPSSLPDLIVNRNAAVVKGNAYPYYAQMSGEGYWPVFLSITSENPATTFLEVVWTRLRMRVGGSVEMFGDDLDLIVAHRLADYRYHPGRGWEIEAFDTVPEAKLRESIAEEWAPTFLNTTEYAVLAYLVEHDEFDTATPPQGWEVDEVREAIERLIEVWLVGSDPIRPSVVRLVTQQCQAVFLPDGRIAAAENTSGRLTRWVSKHFPR